MWDFEIGRTLGIVVRTWPFVLLRIVVYFGITLVYIASTGAGAGVGYGVGHILGDGGPLTFALWGGIFGFGLVSMLFYWLREYILYMVKAGHIAVMVHLIDGREVPGGQNQIAYAKEVVTRRFAETNILFVVDQLVKGAIRAAASSTSFKCGSGRAAGISHRLADRPEGRSGSTTARPAD